MRKYRETWLRVCKNISQSNTVKHQPAYIYARLFKSDDGANITGILPWKTQENFTAIKEMIDIQYLQNSGLFEAVISNNSQVYTYFVEVPGASYNHKQ